MYVTKSALVVAVCAGLVLPGCTSLEKVAQTAPASHEDCRDRWLIERGAKPAISDDTGAGAVFGSLFNGFARSTTSTADANARYRSCLSNFGVTDTDAYEAASRQDDPNPPHLARLAPLKPVYCPPGASVLYGGSSYCVGRRF